MFELGSVLRGHSVRSTRDGVDGGCHEFSAAELMMRIGMRMLLREIKCK